MTWLQPDPGQTPLPPDEAAGLRLAGIATRDELNAAEQANIVAAETWAFARRRASEHLLRERFMLNLHKRMFGQVWRWAGKFRRLETSIGIDPRDIPVQLRMLADDANTWIEFHSYGPDEVALRLAHRLVVIRPFANGNGRHSRLMADLVIESLGFPRFTWGAAGDPATARARYLAALRAADDHDIRPLLDFART